MTGHMGVVKRTQRVGTSFLRRRLWTQMFVVVDMTGRMGVVGLQIGLGTQICRE